MRFFYSRRSMERSELARLVQIDYAREMAFVATVPTPGEEKTLGVVRAVADPDNIGAEFGIILRPELKGSGLGRVLMDKLIRYQRAAGTQRLIARALSENQRIRALGARSGLCRAARARRPRHGAHGAGFADRESRPRRARARRRPPRWVTGFTVSGIGWCATGAIIFE
jgi:acetyltransferase